MLSTLIMTAGENKAEIIAKKKKPRDENSFITSKFGKATTAEIWW